MHLPQSSSYAQWISRMTKHIAPLRIIYKWLRESGYESSEFWEFHREMENILAKVVRQRSLSPKNCLSSAGWHYYDNTPRRTSPNKLVNWKLLPNRYHGIESAEQHESREYEISPRSGERTFGVECSQTCTTGSPHLVVSAIFFITTNRQQARNLDSAFIIEICVLFGLPLRSKPKSREGFKKGGHLTLLRRLRKRLS